MTVLRLCLFWVKSISENAFPYLRVFGCARKIHFPEMLFSWPVNGCKLVSVFILPSNSHFSKNRERAKGERDAPARKERERERGRRERGRSVRCSTSTSPFDFEFVRLRRSTSPSRRLRSQSQHWFVIPDRKPRFVVLDRDLAFVPITIAGAALIRDLAFTFDNTYFVNLFYYSTYFYYYLWALLHFLVLFIGLTYYFS